MFFFFFKFEEVVLDILEEAGIDTSHDLDDLIDNIVFGGFDYVGIRNDEIFGIEIKHYTVLKASFDALNGAAQQLVLNAEHLPLNMKLVLIVSCVVDEKVRRQLQDLYPSVYFVDISNLLYAVMGVEKLKNDLLSSLTYTIDDIEPIEGPINLDLIEHGSYTENLIQEMKSCRSGKMHFRKYETICQELLENAFASDLSLWRNQQKSNSDMYRFDLICRIKENNGKAFWSIVERFFNSKYVVFEFKNYTAPITQKEIYTTEKYLYAKALRSVAIIVAANGYNDNAERAAKGALRENGKLFLLLNTDDLIKINEMKIANEDPSAYLLGKLDNLLLELEK